MKHSPRFLDIVAEAKQRVRETDIDTVRRRLEDGDAVRLIDVREDEEWQKGHIPGAIHIGKGVIERDIEKTIPDTSAAIVLYCGGGYRSVLAADTLQRMGYTNVESMMGGYRGWIAEGNPVDSG
jgi:rhodanese-related sulfurtransferase